MSNLNIKTEKILSMSNIRRIIMLGISLKDEMENIEKGLISEYDSTQTYTKGMSCYYDGYLYKCLYTTTGIWDSNKWEKVGDELSLIDKQTLASMINLSDEEIASLQSLISTEVRLDKCFSASDTYNRLLTVENECKKFTLEQLAKKMGASYKIVTTTSEVTSTEFLYLISNSTAYDIYALIDGVATKLGDTTIDLSNYYTKNEIDSDFLKKTDADGKYITQTSFNSHTSDTDIHTSATEKASYVKKTDITTTIDETSTDDTVPTNKAVYDNAIKDKNIKTYTTLEQLGLTEPISVGDLFVGSPDNSLLRIQCDNDVITGVPHKNGVLIIDKCSSSKFSIEFKISAGGSVNDNTLYIGQLKGIDGTGLIWQRLCTTSIKDVPLKTLTNSSNIKRDAVITYIVKNGMCTVSANTISSTKMSTGNITLTTGLPTPANPSCWYSLCTNSNATNAPQQNLLVRVDASGNLISYIGTDSANYFGSFSYPVAES